MTQKDRKGSYIAKKKRAAAQLNTQREEKAEHCLRTEAGTISLSGPSQIRDLTLIPTKEEYVAMLDNKCPQTTTNIQTFIQGWKEKGRLRLCEERARGMPIVMNSMKCLMNPFPLVIKDLLHHLPMDPTVALKPCLTLIPQLFQKLMKLSSKSIWRSCEPSKNVSISLRTLPPLPKSLKPHSKPSTKTEKSAMTFMLNVLLPDPLTPNMIMMAELKSRWRS